MHKKMRLMARAFWEAMEQVPIKKQKTVIGIFFEYATQKRVNISSLLTLIQKEARNRENKRTAIVTTAYPAGARLHKEVASDLAEYETVFRVDETIIGGIEVLTHDRRIRGTVASMLSKMRNAISSHS